MKPRFVKSAVLSWNFTWMLQRASDVSYQVQEELRDPWFSIFLAVRLCTASLVALQLYSTCILPSCRVCKLSGHFWIKWCHFIVVTLCISLLSVDVAVARSAPMLKAQSSTPNIPLNVRVFFMTEWPTWPKEEGSTEYQKRMDIFSERLKKAELLNSQPGPDTAVAAVVVDRCSYDRITCAGRCSGPCLDRRNFTICRTILKRSGFHGGSQ